ncbi:MAG: hypothetical protein DI634_02480 [Kocuria palustris]|nr:MAG: hypothetical protein DI634_02480 [Kocuria palustris]
MREMERLERSLCPFLVLRREPSTKLLWMEADGFQQHTRVGEEIFGVMPTESLGICTGDQRAPRSGISRGGGMPFHKGLEGMRYDFSRLQRDLIGLECAQSGFAFDLT